MRIHSINKRLGKFADARFGWEKFPEIFYFFRAIAVLHVAPEMILQRCLARLPPPPHCSGRARRSDITLAISIPARPPGGAPGDGKSTRLNSSHVASRHAAFCLEKKRRTAPRKPL